MGNQTYAQVGPMRFAYADPPYLGCCSQYGHFHDDNGYGCWDNPDTHNDLILRLCIDFPDGWALSASSTSLWMLLPMCPQDVRIAAWVKPFAAFKANVRNAYTWEPVIIRGGRRSSRDGAPVTRDHLSEPITMRRGMTGVKPAKFNRWICDQLGYKEGDELFDLFPGSGGMAQVLAQTGLTI